jgi:hypothetical protein
MRPPQFHRKGGSFSEQARPSSIERGGVALAATGKAEAAGAGALLMLRCGAAYAALHHRITYIMGNRTITKSMT